MLREAGARVVSVAALPRALHPLPGESFASLMDRNAHLYEVPLAAFLHRVGHAARENSVSIPSGYGVFLRAELKERIARSLSLKVANLDATLLESFDGRVFEASRSADGSFDSVKTRLREWLYLVGSQACPTCVAENEGAWLLKWRLPWSFACVRHRQFHVLDCPGCQQPFMMGRRDRQIKPAGTMHVPKPGHCSNGLLGSPRGVWAHVCGFEVVKAPTLSISSESELLTVQQRFDDAVAGDSVGLAGEEVPTLEFFRIVRGLCSLMLYAARVEDVAQIAAITLPDEALSKLRKRLELRDATLFKLHREMSENVSSSKRLAAQKHSSTMPADPLVMAVLIAASYRVVDSQSVAEFASRVEPLIELTMVNRGVKGSDVVTRLGLPPVFQQLFALRFGTVRRHRYPPHKLALQPVKTLYSFEIRHLPELYWQDRFQRLFARFFEDLELWELTARRTVSLVLAELVSKDSKRRILDQLGVPRGEGRGGVGRALALVRESGRSDEFHEVVHREAEWLSNCADRVDYQARRKQFQDLLALDAVDWAAISGAVGQGPGHEGSRDVMAAAWVWARLVEGDARYAPALLARTTSETGTREMYRRFVKHSTEIQIELLDAYSRHLLSGGLAGSFRPPAVEIDAAVAGDKRVHYEFGVEHVPQLFWAEVYKERLRKFFRALGVGDRTGRAASSVAVLDLITGMSRLQAGEFLGLDKRFIEGGVSAALQRVRAGVDGEKFRVVLSEFAEQLSAKTDKIDFRARRSLLSDFVDVPQEDWLAICNRAGITPGRAGRRSAFAAAWIWVYATSGSRHYAPALQQGSFNNKTVYTVYYDFCKKFIPALKPELEAYSDELIRSLLVE